MRIRSPEQGTGARRGRCRSSASRAAAGRTLRASTALCLVAALVSGTAGSASASLDQCTTTKVCVWEHLSYEGRWYSDTGDVKDFFYVGWHGSGWSVNNNTTSAAGYGKSCNVRLYDSAGKTGRYFEFGRPGSGKSYRDPDLRNGAGYGPYWSENWNDRVSSLAWKC
jgi:hypothetical protein